MVALTRAYHWKGLIDSGRYSSITELARALGVDRSYVGRIIRLTILAPDIVEAILCGDRAERLVLGTADEGASHGVAEPTRDT